MRLVDADALKKDLKSVTLSNGTLVNTNAVLYLLEEYPTAYDVDKVAGKLEELRKECEDQLQDYDPNYFIDKAIEIVKGGGADA